MAGKKNDDVKIEKKELSTYELKELNIYEKLSMIQNELKVGKSQYNNFGKYSFRSASDILEAAKPICLKYRTVLREYDEIVLISERYYVKGVAILKDLDSDDAIINDSFAREDESKKGMDGSQITGASSSYARKYALNGLFSIDDTVDADETNTHGKNEKNKSNNKSNNKNFVPISSTTLDAIKESLGDDVVRTQKIMKHYGVTNLSKLDVLQGEECYKLIQESNEKANAKKEVN